MVEPTNMDGTVECLSYIIFFLERKTSLFSIRNTLRQVGGLIWFIRNVLERELRNDILLKLRGLTSGCSRVLN